MKKAEFSYSEYLDKTFYHGFQEEQYPKVVKKADFTYKCKSCNNAEYDAYGHGESLCCICGEDGILDDEEVYDCYDDYSSNMPCDNFGTCAGHSCKQYYVCNPN